MMFPLFRSSYNHAMRIFLTALCLLGLLTGCITVETKTPEPPHFVTSTLPAGPAATATLTGTPTAPGTVVPRPTDCVDKAVLMADVTIPDGTRMKSGQVFTKTWRLKNMGTCPWDASYSLAFIAGDPLGVDAPDPVPLTVTLSGETVDVSVELTAPSADGNYTGIYELRGPSGQAVPIGLSNNFWVNIIVGQGSYPTAVAPTFAAPTSDATQAAGGVTPVKTVKSCSFSLNNGYVNELLGLINAARREANIPELTVNAQLISAAQGHSQDMACNNFLSHTGSDGSDMGHRLLAAGYAWSGFLEIIAIGTPQDAMRQWRNDAGHWDAVLSSGVTEIGIGYAYYAQSDFGGYFTVDMGSR
jgi:uncharacterized protein YkwD